MLSYDTNFSAENRKLSDKSNLSFRTFFEEFILISCMLPFSCGLIFIHFVKAKAQCMILVDNDFQNKKIL